jgi:WD40 repeat protein
LGYQLEKYEVWAEDYFEFIINIPVRRKMERDIKSDRTFTSLADKLYFLCELSWEMLSSDEMSLNYKLFPDRIRRLFGVTEKDLDHWHYDMMAQTILTDCIFILHGYTNIVRSVVFSPQGNILASPGDDQTRKKPHKEKLDLTRVPTRWVIERSNAWVERCKSLVKNFERTLINATAKLNLCFIRLMLNRLAHQ